MIYSSSLRRTQVAPRKIGLFARIRAALSLSRERRHLRTLSDSQLLDIGRTRAEVTEEANRPLWDAPSHWKR